MKDTCADDFAGSPFAGKCVAITVPSAVSLAVRFAGQWGVNMQLSALLRAQIDTILTRDRASFAGHLSGILVGLMYTHGPLKNIMEACAGMFPSDIHQPRQQYYFNNSGYGGFQDHPREEEHRSYAAYTAGLSEEEQLERAVRASLRDQGRSRNSPPPYGFRLSSEEEMRRKRLHRFDFQ
ncbi:Rhomboid domain-containing protein 1 [Pteropus alecto]|uniref:Rhomboid domain-containing protein 1 n=1 Tax=Pteropus alecto TaxID=9402 RepID=L5L077_PTEAL|nr:Rhomboid domain-containing protein 1 [Pteropus alecto]